MNPPLLFSSPPPHRPTFLPFPSSLRALVLHIRIYVHLYPSSAPFSDGYHR